ncbi:MAG: aspartyl protease family protein [Candidatus Bipolaricaulota bacterium]|nr:aspartyl protease family protein [Candidatus Bipolaricaulota bacterium]
MGETRAHFKIYGIDGEVAELEALVDTGATFTKIPESLASALGLQAKYETNVELADGRQVKRGLALAEVELEKVERPVLIAIGGEEEKPLIGYTTLEVLGFKVNPITGKLERTVAIEYENISGERPRCCRLRPDLKCPGLA